MNAADRLIGHALSVEWYDLPASAQASARGFLFDTLCVGIAGRGAPLADTVLALAQSWGGQGPCAVLGHPTARLSAPYAAFVNAFQIHAQEYDCVHEPAVAHPMATVGAALLSEVGRGGQVTGAEFLAAMAAGVDVVATLGVAATSPLKFFRPATAGVFGSVAAIARLRRINSQLARDAFGHALSFVSGTMQAHVEGKPTLALQVAGAARSAVEAVDLALAGVPAPVGSIDGQFGYIALFENRHRLDDALDQLGRSQWIEELSWKPFPTGRAAHGAIVALQQMMSDQRLAANDLASFVYRAPPLIARLVGRRPFPGMDVAYARLCFAWLGAVVLTRGTVGLDDFDPERLTDPALLSLAERISVVSDENPDPAAFVPATATATLIDGRVVGVLVEKQLGSPAWPLNREQQLAKARHCLGFGGGLYEVAQFEPILGDFESCADALAILMPQPAAQREG
jgi:2-methylcitrate dehydratase PrpD